MIFSRSGSKRARRKVALVSVLVGSLAAGGVYGQGFRCPDPLVGGEIQDGRHNFEFNSWAWSANAKDFICHCVRNKNRNPVFVEWPDVGLSGWVKLSATIFAMNSYHKISTETRDTELKFGRDKTPITVQTVFPKSISAKLPASSVKRTNYSESEVATNIVEISIAELAVPSAQYTIGMSFGEIDAAVLDNPNILTELVMRFKSTAYYDEESKSYREIEYECSYELGEGGELILNIDEKALQQAVFKRDDPFHARPESWQTGPGAPPMVVRGSASTGGVQAGELEARTAAMQLLSQNGEVLGSIPIRYLSPK